MVYDNLSNSGPVAIGRVQKIVDMQMAFIRAMS